MLFQKICFRLRFKFGLGAALRRWWWSIQGARFGARTSVPRLFITWPHQLQLGDDCGLEDGTTFKFDGIWQSGPSIVMGNRVFVGRNCEFNITLRIEIGDNCLIASGCKFIDHDHGIALNSPMNIQPGTEAAITLGNDVWLGVNVVVLKGVSIGSGAIVAAGAVVTKNIGANEIWAGVPARKLRDRV